MSGSRFSAIQLVGLTAAPSLHHGQQQLEELAVLLHHHVEDHPGHKREQGAQPAGDGDDQRGEARHEAGAQDEFRPGHGMSAALGHEHNESFKIVGILPETGTPWDRAVLVPIEALWTMHGQNPASRHDARGDHAHEEIEAWLKSDLSKLPGASALVVKPTNMAGAYRIRQHLLKTSEAAPDNSIINLMAVFTGEALIELFAVFSAAASALKAFAASSVATSLAAALLTGFVLAKLREKDLRLLRTMGAPRRFILTSVWMSIESAILLACLGALILGTVLSAAAGMAITNQTGISMMPTVGLDEIVLLAVVTAAGAVFAVIPACVVGKSRLV